MRAILDVNFPWKIYIENGLDRGGNVHSSDHLKIVVIVQARQGSTRFPGKVMMEVLDKPLLGYLIDRIKGSKLVHEVVIATTALENDDAIALFCEQMHVQCFRGSVDDVLSRYLGAAQMVSADVIVRITGDCPLACPEVIDKVVSRYLSHYPLVDYVANTVKRTYPRGLDVEVFSYACLNTAAQKSTLISEREHVTPYIYHHPELFNIESVVDSADHSHFRWTVDTPEDFQLISKLISTLYPQKPLFTFEDLLHLMQRHPEWHHINSQIKQKELG